jgi:uncharacterized protein (DUF1778 family)
MSTFALKDARMEIKTTSEAKDFLSKAAVLAGMDLSAFMISSSMERAQTILRDHATIALSAQGQANLVSMLQAQPLPNEAMKELRKLPRLKVRR